MVPIYIADILLFGFILCLILQCFLDTDYIMTCRKLPGVTPGVTIGIIRNCSHLVSRQVSLTAWCHYHNVWNNMKWKFFKFIVYHHGVTRVSLFNSVRKCILELVILSFGWDVFRL